MPRESPYFRDILENLLLRFKKHNISVSEYAEYLGMNKDIVREMICQGLLPGKAIKQKGRKNNDYIIPVASIAKFEDRAC